MSRITRKQFCSLGSAALAAPFPSLALPQTSGRPKNVLLLMSDQHRPHAMSVDGHPVVKTPNLDRLALSGTRFDNAYCTNPVCVPSRASLLTGLYTHSHHTWNNGTPWPFEKKTMAHYFARAGYMTALVGKMHFVDAQTHGFDYHLDFNDWFQFLGPKAKLHADELGKRNSGSGNPQIDDLWRDFGDPWEGVREKDDRKGAVHIGRMSKITEQDQFESFVARESVRFLKNHGNKQPFFLVSSFLKPHDPFMPAERFYNMYRAADMVLPDTWGKLDPSVPRETKDAVRRAAGEGLDAPENAKQRTACYYGSLSEMDFCLGQVLDALHELGLEENTVVVYTSDHGEMLGEHGLWHKFVFYDPSCGVPLIFRVPGLTTAGARSQTPVSLVQMVPTLLELCGLPAPAEADGESFVRDLREPTSRRDTTVYSEYNLRTPRAKYMIRRGDYKYNYYTNDTPELYNLREDPKETRNLAESEKGKAEELKAQLFAWHKPGSEK